MSVSQVSIEIQPACRLDNGSGGTNFGTFFLGAYLGVSNISEATSSVGAGSIGILCSPELPFRVEIDLGLNANASLQRRVLNNSTGETVVYELFQDANFAQPWTPSAPQFGVGSGSFEWLTIYARIPTQNSVPSAGDYQDQLGVTLVF